MAKRSQKKVTQEVIANALSLHTKTRITQKSISRNLKFFTFIDNYRRLLRAKTTVGFILKNIKGLQKYFDSNPDVAARWSKLKNA
jgi:hypothetical protein